MRRRSFDAGNMAHARVAIGRTGLNSGQREYVAIGFADGHTLNVREVNAPTGRRSPTRVEQAVFAINEMLAE